MKSFERYYRRSFELLGFPLKRSDGTALGRIEAAERRLGVCLPEPLRQYYLAAGKESRFNHAHNRLIDLSELEVDSKRLIFLEENQCVVVWGIDLKPTGGSDPKVLQGVTGDEIRWYREHEHCSIFLNVMLHWQAAFGGGMPFTASAPAPPFSRARLKSHWTCVGESNRMKAYSRPGQVVCLLKWKDGEDAALWRVFAGAADRRLFDAIPSELRIEWDGSVMERAK